MLGHVVVLDEDKCPITRMECLGITRECAEYDSCERCIEEKRSLPEDPTSETYEMFHGLQHRFDPQKGEWHYTDMSTCEVSSHYNEDMVYIPEEIKIPVRARWNVRWRAYEVFAVGDADATNTVDQDREGRPSTTEG